MPPAKLAAQAAKANKNANRLDVFAKKGIRLEDFSVKVVTSDTAADSVGIWLVSARYENA